LSTWNDLWQNERWRKRLSAPEADVKRFIGLLETVFPDERRLRIWDLCCGSGHHTALISRCGHSAYATDGSPQAVELTRRALAAEGLAGRVEKAEMEVCPWPSPDFHGVIAWDAIHHNTRHGIEKTVETIERALQPGGLFLATLLSDKAGRFGKGLEIDHRTFIDDEGGEPGVPHHYFDEEEVRILLDRFELLILAEEVTRYVHGTEGFWTWTPFRWTKWNVLARKKT